MSRAERRATRVLGGALAAAAALALLAGCRQDMHDQPRIDPLAENRFFADGSGARPLPANTVARGELRADTAFHSGQAADGSLLTAPPMPVTRELLVRGRERFDIFCAPCHGRAADGTGMVVQRGYKKPSSFHVDRLRQAPVAYFYFVMGNGFGVMPSYAAQIPAADRWAIAAYIRTLQLAHHYDADRLTADERRGLDAAPAHAPAAATAH
ncbi:MAG: cytochrome c [Thermoanaerobaculia bacterium]|nr:cytochrome c [Thermoanaerobaculia bacterium]